MFKGLILTHTSTMQGTRALQGIRVPGTEDRSLMLAEHMLHLIFSGRGRGQDETLLPAK